MSSSYYVHKICNLGQQPFCSWVRKPLRLWLFEYASSFEKCHLKINSWDISWNLSNASYGLLSPSLILFSTSIASLFFLIDWWILSCALNTVPLFWPHVVKRIVDPRDLRDPGDTSQTGNVHLIVSHCQNVCY